jgi:glycosyltransferase involved in cell wall biosynthesis
MAVHPLYLRDGIKPQRKRFGLPENGVLFITSFEPYSDIERKNPMAVLESFRRAFDQSMQAHLIIKVNNPESNLFVKQLQQHYDGSSQIHIIAETMSYTDVLSLYASCDVYVSLHRAEGLGLGLMESMMLGKPVIATAWSGNMTFMNYTNSCPVNYHLVPVKGSIPVYRKEMLGKDAVWADPDIDDAAAWMRRLVDDPDIRTEIGRRAADNMQKWQANALNAKFIDELKIIWENRAIKRDEVALKSQRARWKIMGNQLFLGEKVD